LNHIGSFDNPKVYTFLKSLSLSEEKGVIPHEVGTEGVQIFYRNM
jgi:hypothetical protein